MSEDLNRHQNRYDNTTYLLKDCISGCRSIRGLNVLVFIYSCLVLLSTKFSHTMLNKFRYFKDALTAGTEIALKYGSYKC